MKLQFRGALVTVLSILAAGYMSGASSSTIALTISSDSAVTKRGSDVRIAVTLKNISNATIKVVASPSREQGEMFNEVDVRDVNNNQVADTEYHRILKGKERPKARMEGTKSVEVIIAGSIRTSILKPGETLKEEIVLNKVFDLQRPGQYSVTVRRLDPGTAKIAESNMVTITIAP